MLKPRVVLGELKRDHVIIVCLGITVALLILAIAVPIFSGVDPNAPQLDTRLQPPAWLGGDGGLLGTDELGRDLTIRIAYGIRTSFVVAGGALVLAATIGTAVGLLSGYLGGAMDSLLMRLTDVQLSFPGLLLVMLVIVALGQGPFFLIIGLGLVSWMVFARVVRSAVLSLRNTDLITATQGLGASTGRVLFNHALPNVMPQLTAIAALEFARLLLAEASLSFLGFGIQAPQISLGAMLASGRDLLQSQWWIATFCGLALTLTVLCVSLVGGWLQRISDPTRVLAE